MGIADRRRRVASGNFPEEREKGGPARGAFTSGLKQMPNKTEDNEGELEYGRADKGCRHAFY